MGRGRKTDIEKHADYMSQFKKQCKCGHTMYLSKIHPTAICYWCGSMNYLDEKEEFKSKLNSAIKKQKYIDKN